MCILTRLCTENMITQSIHNFNEVANYSNRQVVLLLLCHRYDSLHRISLHNYLQCNAPLSRGYWLKLKGIRDGNNTTTKQAWDVSVKQA